MPWFQALADQLTSTQVFYISSQVIKIMLASSRRFNIQILLTEFSWETSTMFVYFMAALQIHIQNLNQTRKVPKFWWYCKTNISFIFCCTHVYHMLNVRSKPVLLDITCNVWGKNTSCQMYLWQECCYAHATSVVFSYIFLLLMWISLFQDFWITLTQWTGGYCIFVDTDIK